MVLCRVNLIGEHLDYCGYAVFPMAIDQEILVAWCPTEDNNLVLTNTNPTYDSYSCSVSDFRYKIFIFLFHTKFTYIIFIHC